MTEEEASVAYFKARDLLEEVIKSGHRGDRVDVLMEIEDDV